MSKPGARGGASGGTEAKDAGLVKCAKDSMDALRPQCHSAALSVGCFGLTLCACTGHRLSIEAVRKLSAYLLAAGPRLTIVCAYL